MSIRMLPGMASAETGASGKLRIVGGQLEADVEGFLQVRRLGGIERLAAHRHITAIAGGGRNLDLFLHVFGQREEFVRGCKQGCDVLKG